MDVSFLDSMEPEDHKVRSSLSFSRSEASLWFSEGESENDEPVDVAPATTPRRPTPARSRAAIPRRGSRRLTAALLSWQRSVAVPESLFSELEGKRRRDGSRKAHAAPRFVAAPDSWLALAFTATGFVLTLTHVALLTPAFVAFDAPTRLGAPAEPWPWTAAVDLGVGAFFLANLLVNFRTGVLCSSRTLGRVAVVLDPSSIARVYVKSGAFACDATALLPLVAQCVSSIWLARVGAETAGAEAHVWRLIRLFRLFHLARLGRASGGAIVGDAEALLARGTLFPPLAIWLAQTACEFVFVINTCACAFVYVAHVNGFENSWVRDALERDELASADAADADDDAGVGGRVRVRAVLGGGDGEHGGLRRRCRDEPRRAHRGRRGHDRGQHVVRVACRARRRAGGEARRRVADGGARRTARRWSRCGVFCADTRTSRATCGYVSPCSSPTRGRRKGKGSS